MDLCERKAQRECFLFFYLSYYYYSCEKSQVITFEYGIRLKKFVACKFLSDIQR